MQLANVGLKTHHLNGWFSLRISMMVEIISDRFDTFSETAEFFGCQRDDDDSPGNITTKKLVPPP